jgi:hypothetical protein
MVTLTSKNGRDLSKQERFPTLGNRTKIFLGREKSNTKFFPNKKYIVISARVHPSEVASSYVLKSFVLHILNSAKTDSKK